MMNWCNDVCLFSFVLFSLSCCSIMSEIQASFAISRVRSTATVHFVLSLMHPFLLLLLLPPAPLSLSLSLSLSVKMGRDGWFACVCLFVKHLQPIGSSFRAECPRNTNRFQNRWDWVITGNLTCASECIKFPAPLESTVYTVWDFCVENYNFVSCIQVKGKY